MLHVLHSWWCSHTQRIYLISSHFYCSIRLCESFLFYVLLSSNGKRKHVLSLKLFLLTWLCHFKASQVKWLMKVPTVVINYRFFYLCLRPKLRRELENWVTIDIVHVYNAILYFLRSFKNWKIFQYKVIVFERKILMLWQIGKKNKCSCRSTLFIKCFARAKMSVILQRGFMIL